MDSHMYDFAFLVHPRAYDDVRRNVLLFRLLPECIAKFLLLYISTPLVIGDIKITIRDKQLRGAVISLSLTADQITNHKERAKKQVIKAINIAEKLNAKIIGLGALTSPAVGGGTDIINLISLGITNGNTTTAIISYRSIREYLKHSFNWRVSTVAIVGATGSIGRGITYLISRENPGNLILIGRTSKNLQDLKSEIEKNTFCEITTDLKRIKEADVVVVATNSPSAILTAEYFKEGAFIYDLTEPKNVKINSAKRGFVRLINGGLVYFPYFQSTVDFNLPSGVVFACLMETALLSAEKQYKTTFIGPVTKSHMEKMERIIDKYHIKPYLEHHI